jgi:putative ABC transport system substrate-binding protein
MKRREMLCSTCKAVACACGASFTNAWAAAVPDTVGVLQTSTLTSGASARTVAVLRDAMRALGRVEGRNLKLVLRSAEGRPQALPALAAELVRMPVHVLCAFGPAAVQAAVEATRMLPIVALDLESDPVQAGWARSLSHPGGNVTGLFLNLPDLAGKWLELVRELLPRARRVGVLWDATTGPAHADAVRAAAQRLGLEPQVHAIRSVDDFARALDAAVAGGAQALVMLSSPLMRNGSQQVAEFAAQHRLPTISPFRAFPDVGGLMSYGPELDYFFARAAAFADKILRGTHAGELPIEQPAKFELVINAAAARGIGLIIPNTVLLRANEVLP